MKSTSNDQPRQHHVVRWILIGVAVAFVIWFVLGSSVGTGSASAAATGGLDQDASLGGDVRPMDLATDASTLTPQYSILGLDKGKDVGVGSGTSFIADADYNKRNDHLACGTAKFTKWHTNIWGARLFTVKHKVFFCVDDRYPNRCGISHISDHVFVDINGAGSVGQWRKDYGEKMSHYFPWRQGNFHSGYASTKVMHFWRGATLFGQDVVLGRSQIATHIRLHCNGHYWRG